MLIFLILPCYSIITLTECEGYSHSTTDCCQLAKFDEYILSHAIPINNLNDFNKSKYVSTQAELGVGYLRDIAWRSEQGQMVRWLREIKFKCYYANIKTALEIEYLSDDISQEYVMHCVSPRYAVTRQESVEESDTESIFTEDQSTASVDTDVRGFCEFKDRKYGDDPETYLRVKRHDFELSHVGSRRDERYTREYMDFKELEYDVMEVVRTGMMCVDWQSVSI